MKTMYLLGFGLVTLAACATVQSESRSSIVVDGRTYELRTQVIDGPNGPYNRSFVMVKNRMAVCLPESPGDCEAAVRLARSDFDRE